MALQGSYGIDVTAHSLKIGAITGYASLPPSGDTCTELEYYDNWIRIDRMTTDGNERGLAFIANIASRRTFGDARTQITIIIRLPTASGCHTLIHRRSKRHGD